MNSQIVDNLFQFWGEIGRLTEKLREADTFSTVSMEDSDWPNRIFNLKNNFDLNRILKLSQERELPEILTVAKPNELTNHHDVELLFRQRNMSINLDSFSDTVPGNSNIKRVETKGDASLFAITASESFKYKVDANVVSAIVSASDEIRLFIYQEGNECLACGIVFFDSNSNAGLHMIGTIPRGRGKGIGKAMTERLLIEAKNNAMRFCVLHASSMGESIYRKLGFEPFGEIETYKVLRNAKN